MELSPWPVKSDMNTRQTASELDCSARASLVAQVVKNPPATWETRV